MLSGVTLCSSALIEIFVPESRQTETLIRSLQHIPDIKIGDFK